MNQLCSVPFKSFLKRAAAQVLRQPEGQKRQERQRKPNREVACSTLSVLYLLNRLIHADGPFTGDLERVEELDGFFLALPTLDSGELQPVPGDAEGRLSHDGTEADLECGASCDLEKDRASS